ncbi:hypothetical protein CRG98_003064 [Punica granatum]|uniref:Uncharacterized protein n=1 Tax=Punica granatum TaxID=22663 RepID=A0A2I0L7A0_PUNGR|nr:hypothetical protein CRG98_003064 [Punica granatum]
MAQQPLQPTGPSTPSLQDFAYGEFTYLPESEVDWNSMPSFAEGNYDLPLDSPIVASSPHPSVNGKSTISVLPRHQTQQPPATFNSSQLPGDELPNPQMQQNGFISPMQGNGLNPQAGCEGQLPYWAGKAVYGRHDGSTHSLWNTNFTPGGYFPQQPYFTNTGRAVSLPVGGGGFSRAMNGQTNVENMTNNSTSRSCNCKKTKCNSRPVSDAVMHAGSRELANSLEQIARHPSFAEAQNIQGNYMAEPLSAPTLLHPLATNTPQLPYRRGQDNHFTTVSFGGPTQEINLQLPGFNGLSESYPISNSQDLSAFPLPNFFQGITQSVAAVTHAERQLGGSTLIAYLRGYSSFSLILIKELKVERSLRS